MPAVLSAFDIACSASAFGEGFSNAIAEAMACEIPCVGTNVGDTAALIGDTGAIVPPGDPDRLSSAIASLLVMSTEERADLGRRARERIIENFGIRALVRRTRTAWQSDSQ